MRVRLLALALAIFLAAAAGTAPAQEVRIDVGAPATGRGVPPVFQFGGGVWRVPKVMSWVAPSILDLRGGGTYRAALSWEVLAASQDLADLKERLRTYPLNSFLKQVKAKSGQVIISLDGMPKWLASDRSEAKLADGPAWAKSAPKSGEQWAAVVQAAVEHFNGALGLDALYEVWNEPEPSFRGSIDQYFDLYRWTVVGAKRADKGARIAGPALSDWTSPGASGEQFYLQSFLQYAARTPAPEVGLKRLPVDAVTWHAFYRNHASSYALAAKQIRAWLEESGFAQKTTLILDEWNIASAEPPYPEGDINGGYAGAAYVAATLMAMDEAGIDRQTYQMMVDPGSQGYSGGAFTPAGVARPNFNAFRLFARLRGKELPVQSSQKWVRAVAFDDGKQVHLIVAVAPPSDYMLARGVFESLPFESPAAYREIGKVSRQALTAFLLKNGELPSGLSAKSTEILERGRDEFVQERQERDTWRNGVAIRIALAPGLGIKQNSERTVFDRKHAPDGEEMDRTTSELQSVLRDSLDEAQKSLDKSGIDPGLKQRYWDAVKERFDAKSVIESADQASQPALKQADRILTQDFANRLSSLDRAGQSKIAAQPVAIQNSSIELRSEGIALHYLVLGK